MKPFRWGAEKSGQLKLESGISFEQMVIAVEAGGLLDVLAHPNPLKYPNQKVLVIASDNYVCTWCRSLKKATTSSSRRRSPAGKRRATT